MEPTNERGQAGDRQATACRARPAIAALQGPENRAVVETASPIPTDPDAGDWHGVGGIAHYFATHPTLRVEVDAVDTRDNRLIKEGYRYRQVTDARLPFAGESFDVVLSNHVIEHVGNAAEQRRHLQEIRRVMRWNGVGYLTVPNR